MDILHYEEDGVAKKWTVIPSVLEAHYNTDYQQDNC